MMRCSNADDLRHRLEDIFAKAPQVRATLDPLMHVDSELAGGPDAEKDRQAWLECHTRDYIINHILSALNWCFAPSLDARGYISQNIVTEQNPAKVGQPTTGPKESYSKKLDYLGYDSDSDQALMAVEAKSIRMKLFGSSSPEASPDSHPLQIIICDALSHIRRDKDTTDHNQDDGPMTADWMNAIRQIRNYCLKIWQVTEKWPVRAVLTNGDWLIVFCTPQDCFNQDQTKPLKHREILVFESHDVLISRCELLWQHIEYGALSKKASPIGVGEIRSLVNPAEIESCSFGLHLLYQSEQAIDEPNIPLIKVSPRIFLRGSSGGVIQVKTRDQEIIPRDGSSRDLSYHLETFRDKSLQLKQAIETMATDGRVLPLVSAIDHCTSNSLRIRPLTEQLTRDNSKEEYIYFTGAEPHFLKTDEMSKRCDFHCHKVATTLERATQTQTFVRSTIEPRSYFLDDQEHHCRHEYVEQNKAVEVTEQNDPASGQNGKAKFGHRSEEVGSAFCLVWPVEKYLCCRTCIFHPVCDKAAAFSLPCDTGISITRDGRPIDG